VEYETRRAGSAPPSARGNLASTEAPSMTGRHSLQLRGNDR
jgi:hypothetical protein